MRGVTVILAAGDFPRRGSPARRILDDAARVVCCDGAADAYRKKTGREPTVVIGDGDSVKGRFARQIRVTEQDTNDLEKAIRFCKRSGWKNPVVLGATGKREDHALGNIFRAMEHALTIVTDHGRFVPIVGTVTLAVGEGAPVSVFANPGTRMKSTGLEWPLDGIRFEAFHRATLNRAHAHRITIESSKRAYVFL